MRLVRSLKNIQILGKKSASLRDVPYKILIGQVTEKIDESTREIKILGKFQESNSINY